jgi:hypothetical protein
MTGGKLLRLERMIPTYGIIVKHKFPYACLFRNFWVEGYRRIAVKYKSRDENYTFWLKTIISAGPLTEGMALSIEEKLKKMHF